MKRKIAVFTNGWNDDYLDFALEGIKRRASQDNIDVFIFMDYTSYDKTEGDIVGELNILNLPRLRDFDGVLLLGNTLNNAGENAILREKILDAKVPSLCLEYSLEDINCIRTENITGMKELMEHMITEHGVKDIFWISGPRDNEESNERYRAIVDTMEKHGFSVDPEKSFDGCWSYAIVEEKLPEVIAKLDKLPDAFICANDSMALSACMVLDKAGYKVPEDVRVTGFDNLMSGNHFSPILTSVDRGWQARSYQAMDSLIALMNGEPDFGDKVYPSTFDMGESCGCSMGSEGLRLQKEARTRAFGIPVERTIFDWHLIEFDEAVANVKSHEDLYDAYESLLEKDHSYEGNDFFICLDQKFVDSMEEDISCNTIGYSDTIDVIYGMDHGVSVPRHTIPTGQIAPLYDPDTEETVIYLMVPLHTGSECLGYYVSKNYVKTIKEFYINSLTRHIASGLTRARQNIRLEKLNRLLADISVRDELTGLYNRMGYEKIAIPYLDELRRTKRDSVIMVADINRMKMISVSIGYVVIDPDNDLGNEEYFRMADEAMYEMKQEAHRNEGGGAT